MCFDEAKLSKDSEINTLILFFNNTKKPFYLS